MRKIIQTTYLLYIACTILSCNHYDRENDNIIFRPRWWMEMDLKNRSISVELTKYKGKLVLSEKEEKIIIDSFEKNEIGSLKGEYHVANEDVIAPIVDFTFVVFKRDKKILDAAINEGYDTQSNSKSIDDKIASFRDDLKSVLRNNPSYKLAEKNLEDYMVKHDVFML